MGRKRKEFTWPVMVTATTYTEDGHRHKINRTVEGAGNAEGAMLKAVLAQPDCAIWLGCEIVGVTGLGQVIKRVFRHEVFAGGEYVLERKVGLTKEELSKLGKRGVCEECGSKKGTYMTDPYESDMHSKEIFVCLCDECADKNANEI